MAQHQFVGSGPPAIVPTDVLQHYLDTTNKKEYISVGTGSVSDWVIRQNIANYVASFNGRSGAVTPQSGDYTASQVGADPLGAASSAVSTHEAAADPHTQYQKLSDKGSTNGYAPLVNGVIPSAYMPSYVDDILEYANLTSFPLTGETGKVYIAINTNKQYRWSGTTYTEIISSPGTTDNVPEGTNNLYFTNSRAISASPQGILTGLSLANGDEITPTDTILQALGKIQSQINVWTELITTSDLTQSSSATSTQISELGFPVVSGSKYRIEITMRYSTAATTTGIGVSLNTPDGASGTIAAVVSMLNGADGVNSGYSGSITSLADFVTSNSVPAANTDSICRVEGIFSCVTSGTLAPYFRSEVNGSSVTVKSTSINLVREF